VFNSARAALSVLFNDVSNMIVLVVCSYYLSNRHIFQTVWSLILRSNHCRAAPIWKCDSEYFHYDILEVRESEKSLFTGLGNGNILRIQFTIQDCLSIPVDVLKIKVTESFACLSWSTNVCNISVNHSCVLPKGEVTGVSSSFVPPSCVTRIRPSLRTSCNASLSSSHLGARPKSVNIIEFPEGI
jgi:hypothetical protein